MTIDKPASLMEEPPDPWAPALREVAALLEQYKVIDGLDSIPDDAFMLVVGRIIQFRKRPITDPDMAKLKALGSQQVARREILDRAADILRGEISLGKWKDIPGLNDHLRRWEEAIAVLQMQRGATENPRDWLRGAKKGPAVRASTYMATEIATQTMQVLKSFHVQVSLRNTSGFVRFIRDALKFIGVNNPPSEKELSKVLRKNLAMVDMD
jgi:hypothetical protein